MPAKSTPSQLATMSPMRYWPWPPMLNMPQRNANATASPQRISVVVCSRVCDRLYADVFTTFVVGWKIQFRPGAVEDVAIREERVVPGRENDEAAHEECDEHRRGRDSDPAGALLQREARDQRPALRRLLGRLGRGRVRVDVAHAAVFSRPPSISSPISSSDTSPVCSPTISPS